MRGCWLWWCDMNLSHCNEISIIHCWWRLWWPRPDRAYETTQINFCWDFYWRLTFDALIVFKQTLQNCTFCLAWRPFVTYFMTKFQISKFSTSIWWFSWNLTFKTWRELWSWCYQVVFLIQTFVKNVLQFGNYLKQEWMVRWYKKYGENICGKNITHHGNSKWLPPREFCFLLKTSASCIIKCVKQITDAFETKETRFTLHHAFKMKLEMTKMKRRMMHLCFEAALGWRMILDASQKISRLVETMLLFLSLALVQPWHNCGDGKRNDMALKC